MNVEVEKCCFTWQLPLQSLDVLVVGEAVSPDLPLPCRESTCWHTGANVGEEVAEGGRSPSSVMEKESSRGWQRRKLPRMGK